MSNTKENVNEEKVCNKALLSLFLPLPKRRSTTGPGFNALESSKAVT